MGKGFWIGVILFALIGFGLVFGGMYYIDKVGWDNIKKELQGIEDRSIEMRDIQVTFKDGRVGLMDLVVVLKDEKEDVAGYEVLFREHLVKHASQVEITNVNDFQEGYRMTFDELNKRHKFKIDDVYVDRFVMWIP